MCGFLLYYFHQSFPELNLNTHISLYRDQQASASSSPSPTSTTLRQTTSPPMNTTPFKPTPRPNTCKGCFHNSFDILLENPNICKTKPGDKLDMVIIIFTYIKSTNRRNVIRKTWTQHTKNNTGSTRYFFAFGKYRLNKSNTELAKEADAHGDLVQASFGESYYNLTYKTVTMFGWVAKNCRNAKLVMKTDDDMWVNIPQIIQRFNKEPLSKTIAGFCMTNARPIRSESSKWYASVQKYPRNEYPDFCSGTGYVMDMDTARDIHRTSVDVPFLYLEDVYVALCLEHLGKSYHVRPTSGFHNGKYPMTNLCSFKSYVLTSHYMTPQDIQNIWNAKC